MLYYVYFDKVEYCYLFFWKFQIVLQSLNSPNLENLLLGDDLGRVF